MKFKKLFKKLGTNIGQAAKKRLELDDPSSNAVAQVTPDLASSPDASKIQASLALPKPRISEEDDPNFTFAGFNWEAYNDSRTEEGEKAMAQDMSTGPEQVTASSMKLVWLPITTKLSDGSTTIAFKVPTDVANKLMAADDQSPEYREAQKQLLTRGEQVITTPSREDRRRGMRPDRIVIRTPASLIDLMDDQVPDLREGFWPEAPSDAYLQPFSGAPMAGGIPVYLIFEAAQAILSACQSAGVKMTLPNIIKLLKGIVVNGNPFTMWGNIIRKITSGELSRWLELHRDADIGDAIRDWITEVMFGLEVNSATNPVSDDDSSILLGDDNNRRSLDMSGSTPGSGRDHLQSQDVRVSGDQGTPQWEGNYHLTSDRDEVCVPVAYWKRLYSMGSSFQRRDACPHFDKLMLTGSPATDLILNRVPSIYIQDNGLPVLSTWQYGTYPLAGGIFKKIAKGIKKVTKAVAKGITKVMDGPLGAVISAVPVVGNIASVAGKVAKGVTKVMDKIDSIKDKAKSVIGGKSEDETADVQSTATEDTYSDQNASGQQEVVNHGRGLFGPASYADPSNTQSHSVIDINSLPVWTADNSKPYEAPPLSLLSHDPTSSPLRIRCFSNMAPLPLLFGPSFVGADELSDMRHQEAALRSEMLAAVSDLDKRGPEVLYTVKFGQWKPLSGDSKSFYHGTSALGKRSTGYWNSNNSLRQLRQKRIRLAGDPDVTDDIIRSTLESFSPMAGWAEDPRLVDPTRLNPFCSIFFQLSTDSGTKTLLSGKSFNSSALSKYVFDSPMISRAQARQVNSSSEVVASIVWAMYLVTSNSLSDDKRLEIAQVMKQCAIAGLWTGKGVDTLLQLALDSKWPSSEDMRKPSPAQTWTRMVASTILYIWNEASAGSINSFTNSILSVSAPSRTAVETLKLQLDPSQSQLDSSSSINQVNSWETVTQQKEVPKTTAESGLQQLLAALGSDREYSEAAELPQSVDDGLNDRPRTLSSLSSNAVGDMVYQAESICRSVGSAAQAIPLMNSLDIPPSIIGLVIRRYFPSYQSDSDFGWRLSILPLSRRDYVC